MNAILPMVLALCGFADPPAGAGGPAPAPAPVMAVACGDWIDLALLLESSGVETCVLDVYQHGDVVVVAALHAVGDSSSSAFSWVGYYAFPSSVYAHSVVTVPFHADEME